MLPFPNLVVVDAAHFKELGLVIDHFLPREAGEGIIFHQENGFLRADFLAETAKDAAQHIDFEFLGRLFDIAGVGRTLGSGRGDANGFWGANEFA
jgi:hypothetical protein